MNNKINSIQLLRAVAVILVIYNHSIIICTDNNYNFSFQRNFLYLRHWTSIGLDLFFVISGLIMAIVTRSYIKKPSGWYNFLLKRVLRIVPLYWLYSFVVYAERNLLNHPVSPGEIVKTLLFFPLLVAKNTIYPIIGQGWSLTYEMYFYFLIVVFLLLKNKKNLFRNLLIAMTALAIAGYLINPADLALKFISTPILIEFSLGMAVGMGYHYFTVHYTQIWIGLIKYGGIAMLLIGLALMLASLFYDSQYISNPYYVINNNSIALYRSLIWGLPCSIFVFGVLLTEYGFQLEMPSILVKIGDASFSGYLSHILIIVSVGWLYTRLGLRNGDAFIIIATLTSTLISLPLYLYIEKPILNFSNRLFSPVKASPVLVPVKETN
jgi:exopolysaccharide production protein ExoZ